MQWAGLNTGEIVTGVGWVVGEIREGSGVLWEVE